MLFEYCIFCLTHIQIRHAVAQLVEALRYKPEGRRFDSRWCYWNFSLTIIPHDRLLMKLAASGMDSRVVIWAREFFVGRTQRVRLEGQQSNEVKVTSGVLQGGVLGPLLFLVYVKNIWRNSETSIRLFPDD